MSDSLTSAQVVESTKRLNYGTWRFQKSWNPLHVVDAEGCYFIDAAGKRYLDFSSQLMCVNLGHKNPAVIKSIEEQARALPYIAPSYASDARAKLSNLLLEVLPKGLEKFFFTTSGTDANEAAFKIARTSDRLYFEPLTLEDVLAIVEKEKPQGVIVQFGGQTPLNLAMELKRNGVPIIGTTPESIDLAEDRRRFGRVLDEQKIPQPRNGTALIPEEAARLAAEIGLPVLVRPSYVLGGRAMVIAYDANTVQEYVAQAALMGSAKPVLIDQFLEEATEVDVDALADGTDVVIGGIMEHIEEAGVHSGDSSCVLPPVSLSPAVLETIRDYTKRLALALKVVGLMNVQYAIQRDTVYVLEVNPRASRTVPYVSKATGVQLAKVAARIMVGKKLKDMKLPLVHHGGVAEIAVHDFYSVKSPVFPFNKFRGVDTILGPEMRSTGEVMGISTSYGQAFAKAQLAAGQRLPRKGTVFLSVNDRDKRHLVSLGKELGSLGFKLVATRGTAAALLGAGIEAEAVFKVNEGRPNIVDLVKTGKIDLVINTPLGRESFYDEKSIRRAAIRYNIPCITTLAAANAAARGIRAMLEQGTEVSALQDLHRGEVPASGSAVSGD